MHTALCKVMVDQPILQYLSMCKNLIQFKPCKTLLLAEYIV